MKVIKVDDFKKAFCDLDCFEEFFADVDGKMYVDVTSFLNFLDTMPTIESEPVKHGKWIAVTLGDMRCLCCGSVYGVCGGLIGDYNYCPNCGAKMDLEE